MSTNYEFEYATGAQHLMIRIAEYIKQHDMIYTHSGRYYRLWPLHVPNDVKRHSTIDFKADYVMPDVMEKHEGIDLLRIDVIPWEDDLTRLQFSENEIPVISEYVLAMMNAIGPTNPLVVDDQGESSATIGAIELGDTDVSVRKKLRRPGVRPLEFKEKKEFVLGWYRAEAEDVTQTDYCRQKGIGSTSTLRKYKRHLRNEYVPKWFAVKDKTSRSEFVQYHDISEELLDYLIADYEVNPPKDDS